MTETLRAVGEFGFIKRISPAARLCPSVVKGIGDDCAVLRYSRDRHLLFTTDMIIEGVHFKRNKADPKAIGHKALAVNISDIIACGGIPKWAVVSAGVSPRSRYSYIKDIYAGIRGLAGRFGIDIVGGDTNSSDKIVISIALIGLVEKRNLIMRSGAKRGDIILLSGPLDKRPDDLTFTPPLKKIRGLLKNFKVNSMIDISDGFFSDLNHILDASGAGAIIYEPMLPFRQRKVSALEVLNRGEQFEFIITLSGARLKSLPKGFYPVGEIVDEKYLITYVTRDGLRKKISPKGYSHF